jgi:hypothetical protein
MEVMSMQVSGFLLSFKANVPNVEVILRLFIVGTPIVELTLEQ